jgi:hypothetical protein
MPRVGYLNHCWTDFNADAARWLQEREQMPIAATHFEHRQAFWNHESHERRVGSVKVLVSLDPGFPFCSKLIEKVLDHFMSRFSGTSWEVRVVFNCQGFVVIPSD